jgi:hypothetical protein
MSLQPLLLQVLGTLGFDVNEKLVLGNPLIDFMPGTK